MLTQLQIRNFVIIDQLDLSFASGMTVLTGETGAGKSILIDALGLILGDKAEVSMIREDQERAELVATFNVSRQPRIRVLLDEQAIETGDHELVIRRVISRDGRSKAFINSSPVAIQLLKTLGESLIDIHGQHAHQSLMNRNAQRALLDSYAGHQAELDTVNKAWNDWNSATRQLAQLSTSSGNHEASINLLKYQVQELLDLNLEEGEMDKLEEEFKRLGNSSRLQQSSQKVLNQLSENELSADTLIHNAIRELKDLIKFDPQLNATVELLDNASIQLGEAINELSAASERFESDPEQLDKVGKRLDLLHDLARKHHVPVQQLLEHQQQLQSQLDLLQNSSEAVSKLTKDQSKALARYQQAASHLSESRSSAAVSMAEAVTSQLHTLGMAQGKFVISLNQAKQEQPQSGGNDQIEFLVSMNPGHPPQPLRKVASGGELSRVSLAIQIISKDEKAIPTLIFDEVDAGIGGGTAEVVGKLLKDLARHSQVFCVTHLPQVASQGHHHLQISKHSAANATLVRVIELNGEDRVDEVARMLGGIKISDKTRAHAREMLVQMAKA